MKKSVRATAVIGMGIALYVVLSLCLQVPVFENYYLCLGYVAMAVYSCAFGAVPGVAVGALGVVLYCLLTNGLRGMPGWAMGNVVIGGVLGSVLPATKKWKNTVLRWSVNTAAVVASVAVGILVVKSGTECVLYAQPFFVRAAKNIYAFAADVFMLLVSLPLCDLLEPQLRKRFSDLVKE